MQLKTLVINTGSSSIKFALYQMPDGEMMASGLVEQIGETTGKIKMLIGKKIREENREIANHLEGLNLVAAWLTDARDGVIAHPEEIEIVGHRVVLGGESLTKTTLIDGEVMEKITELIPLAPLHNPANIQGIEVATKIFDRARQVAVFDTAFHQTIPAHAYRYALPNELYVKHGVRVYGYHGTSHRYVTKATAAHLNIPLTEINLITIHLGNGCSMAAVKNGASIDTSLGMTPLTGLIMGTRSGDVDPGILIYLSESLGYTVPEIKNLLYKESGMKGITGENDIRTITGMAEKGEAKAKLALAMYAYRIKKYIGAYVAALGTKPHAIVFTAGVGENSALIRKMVCENLTHLGLVLDEEKNSRQKGGIRTISSQNSPITILVTPTNEELEIARQSYELLAN